MAPPGGERGDSDYIPPRRRTATPKAQKLCLSAQCFHLKEKVFTCGVADRSISRQFLLLLLLSFCSEYSDCTMLHVSANNFSDCTMLYASANNFTSVWMNNHIW